jgi:hypothetical protein
MWANDFYAKVHCFRYTVSVAPLRYWSLLVQRRPKMLAKIFAVVLVFVPVAAFAQCTLGQIARCQMMVGDNLCNQYYCVPKHTPLRPHGFRCAVQNKLNGSACSNVTGCVPSGACFNGTCVGTRLSCTNLSSAPVGTLCFCVSLMCNAVNTVNPKQPLNATKVCSKLPPYHVFLPLL